MYIPGVGLIEDDITRLLDQVEETTASYVDDSLLAQARLILLSAGIEVDSQSNAIDDVIAKMIYNNEWDTDSPITMIEALSDGYLSEGEALTLLGLEEIPIMVVDTLEDDDSKVVIIVEEIVEELDVTKDDPWWELSPIDWIFDSLVLEPLEAILISVSKNLGERLEKFIANAIGVELEE